MIKIFLISLFTFLFFTLEFIWFNTIGPWMAPNFLLLVVIFFTLSLGIRYGIFTGILAGLLKDSFSIGYFGLNIFSFIFCAYMTVILRRAIYYHTNIGLGRLALTFIILLWNGVINISLRFIFSNIHLGEAFEFILFPEIASTLIVSVFVYDQLKACVLKLSS